MRQRPWLRLLWLPILCLAAVFMYLRWHRPAESSVVVYCAHDAIYAQAVFDEFTRQTGIRVVAVYDTEASKSLGLQERLIAEGSKTPCDVFWNNELLGTLDLARRGLFQPCQGPGWNATPAQHRDDQGLWTGFAGRVRMWIRRGAVAAPGETPTTAVWDRPSLAGVLIAKPLYGTTLTQAALLWSQLGSSGFQHWLEDALQRGLTLVDGNGTVARRVAAGAAEAGWTDTDDLFACLDEKAPVHGEPVLHQGKAILIPNTVALLAGSTRPEAARRLIEHLLSPATEMLLAKTAGQIPLGTRPICDLPSRVAALVPVAAQAWDLRQLLDARNACRDWLKQRP